MDDALVRYRRQSKTDAKSLKRAGDLATVFASMDADIIGIAEGPNTIMSSSKTASAQIEEWAAHFGLDANYKAAKV